jgi:hypothetical protein
MRGVVQKHGGRSVRDVEVDFGFIFEPICERREKYWVKYTPAIKDSYFADLALVYFKTPKVKIVIANMEKEATEWISRYPIPLRVSASDDADNVIQLKPHCQESHLIVLPDASSTVFHWRLLLDDEFPHGKYTDDELIKIYSGLGYTTQAERDKRILREARQFRRGKYIIFGCLWLLLPIMVFSIEITFPVWGILVGLFGIWKAYIKFAKAVRWLSYSEKEKQQSKEEQEKEHYHYHCKRNPNAFLRLKHENFKIDAKKETQRIAEETGRE